MLLSAFSLVSNKELRAQDLRRAGLPSHLKPNLQHCSYLLTVELVSEPCSL